MTPLSPMRCPSCNGHVVQKSGRVRLKGSMTIQKSGKGLAGQCYWCNHAVVIPLELQAQERLYIPAEPKESSS